MMRQLIDEEMIRPVCSQCFGFASVLGHYCLGDMKGIWPVKTASVRGLCPGWTNSSIESQFNKN